MARPRVAEETLEIAMAEATITDFNMRLEFVSDSGQVIRDRRLTRADFSNAIRHVGFDAFRLQIVNDFLPLEEEVRIEPLFPDAGSTSPRAKGFVVTVRFADGCEHHCDFSIDYFAAAANRLRAELLRTEVMTSEEQLYFRLNAFLDEEEPARPENKLAISLDPPTQQFRLVSGSRRDFGQGESWDESIDSDLPVLIDRTVLDEAVDEARDNPEREIAGFLLGKIHRDDRTNEVFVSVTGLASACGTTESTGTSVTFTPASFAEVRNITKLRAGGEAVIGWYHSHPFRLCAECPLPTPPECIAKVLFYSLDDIHLMDTTFEQPFMVGLLAAVEPRIEEAIGHLPVKLYGWHNGEIKERGFEVVRANTN
jgi:proteasome lid subunit RPN8/RPN11